MKRTTVHTRRDFLRIAASGAAHVALLSALPSWATGTCRHTRAYGERSFYTMGTVVTISAYGESRSHVHHAVSAVAEEFRRLDALLSVYQPTSRVVEINRNAGRENVRVEPEILDLLVQSRRFHELTDQAFDVTVEPLMKLWGFRKEKSTIDRIPGDREIARTLEAVGFRNVLLNERDETVGLRSSLSELDFGGIGVGFSVDRGVEILRREGIEACFLNHSGDAYALGTPEDADGWDVGIPNPTNPDEIVSSFRVRDRAVSTSGSYENYVEVDARRYGHILDPATGRPSENVLSTTVVAPSAVEADAWSTALFCLGTERTGSALQNASGLKVITVDRYGVLVEAEL